MSRILSGNVVKVAERKSLETAMKQQNINFEKLQPINEDMEDKWKKNQWRKVKFWNSTSEQKVENNDLELLKVVFW